VGEIYKVSIGYQVPPDQRLATSSAVKPEGKTSNGGPKPGGNEGAGSVLSPEICIFVVTG
jgi:hypothetical protein